MVMLVLLATGLAALSTFAHHQHWLDRLPSFLYLTLFFLVSSTALIFKYLFKESRPDFFVQLYLLTMAVKLMAYLAYNLLIILKDKPGAALNVVFFMIAYFLFTILELAFLLRKVQRT